ncbi:MAG: CDP-diacylglycerol--glycerol-3-phosphate 3-phosphatidyltransferase [Oscillospiraceae bacterium]|nr:MAG: CDP-diacylglycerol--glycerol-3-phosphate 3-phosphatidyltransferase [Oscillospiraceae bacterium]
MNLPNRLTVLRIILVPFFVFFLLTGSSTLFRILALVLFCAASLTDLLDGKIARSRGLVTTFGKLMDPLADKILVMSAMVCFVRLGYAPAAVVIIILGREFLVTSLRLIAAGEGKVIAADRWGKIKTVTQMGWIIVTLLWIAAEPFLSVQGLSLEITAAFYLLMQLLMAASLFFTLLSGFNYCYQNRALFLHDM